MAYEATAEIYRRQADLARKRAQSQYDLAIGGLASQYQQANRDLEANLESRGILRSGEAMRGRTRLGAAEKAAQVAAESARQGALDQADLTLMQQLAGLQAQGYTGGGGSTSPAPSPTGDVKPDTGSNNTILGYPKEVWDKINWDALGSAPGTTPRPTVGGTPVPAGQTPSETRGGGTASNTVPAGTLPGAKVGGPDRKLANGGAVVNGIYIPPGVSFGAPLRPIQGAY